MIRKAPKVKKDVRTVVIKALNSPGYKYRTASGVARETHLSAELVRKILESDHSVRKSLARSKSGAQLYAVKKRVSGIEDAWNAFRALNAAKFGG